MLGRVMPRHLRVGQEAVLLPRPDQAVFTFPRVVKMQGQVHRRDVLDEVEQPPGLRPRSSSTTSKSRDGVFFSFMGPPLGLSYPSRTPESNAGTASGHGSRLPGRVKK